MAIVSKRACDLCKSEDDVNEMIVSFRFQQGRPWAVDLCASCYRARFDDLFAVSHSVKRSNLRPQYRVKETEVTAAQLKGKPRERG